MLKLASWNLHRCIGSDGKQSVDRCGEVLQQINADIVVLQEVESHPGHEFDALAKLARVTNSQFTAGTTMKLETSDYGNAVLSRLPYVELRHHDLSVNSREPRMAMDFTFEINGRRLQLLATHLGLRPAERREQVRLLFKIFDWSKHDIVVLAGDLNEWWPWGRSIRNLQQVFPGLPRRRSWPARFPLFALDRILVSPLHDFSKIYTFRAHLAREASDHLPLVSELSF